MPDQALLFAPWRSRAWYGASAHDAGARTGIDACTARPGLRIMPAGIRARYSRRPRQGAGRPELSVTGKFFFADEFFFRRKFQCEFQGEFQGEFQAKFFFQ